MLAPADALGFTNEPGSPSATAAGAGDAATQDEPLEVLFLGDQGHHQPLARFNQLRPVLESRGIRLTYTQDMRQLNPETLANYDVLLLYANIDRIEDAQAESLLDFVRGGKGFVPLHCASYCFRNNEEVVELIGAQFLRHGGGVFRTRIAEPKHPIMQDFLGFSSWDETYVHHKHAEEGRTVLAYRDDDEGSEPWTWVKTYGQGRVFYTAWGHDARTWSNAGFQNLVERGIRWTAKDDPAVAGEYVEERPFDPPTMQLPAADAPAFEYVDVGAKIPNYTPGEQWGTQGEPLSLMPLPLAPEDSLQHYAVPEGFQLKLFASEPELGGKPIFMTWDEQGRLWVCETVDYPNDLQPPGQGRDRIRICEDTDGDGRADKFTLFAEGLSIPTAITFWKDWVIVQNGVETLRLRDTDGDDRADEREVLFDGWALGDTHGGVSNFQYGLDNWIWAMQGYNRSRPTIDGEPTQTFRQGFFRFRPDGSELEFVRSTNNNTWGLGISEEGIIFGSTANGNPSVYMPIPNRYYESVRGWSPRVLNGIADSFKFAPITDKVRQVDFHGGYTAGAGHALYTARTYPSQFWNRTAFVNGPTGHLVGLFVLEKQGSDFRSTSPMNLVASQDEWSAPIMSEVGPDGHVWVLDWYNYIVQHNPTPRGFETGRGNAYESDLRDKKHGRVYRVVYEGGQPSPMPNLAELEPGAWVSQLSNPNMLWRKQAQRLLVQRGETDVVPALLELLADTTVDELGLNVAAIHALWTLHGLGATEQPSEQVENALMAALSHPSSGVRRNAVQVLPLTADATAAILQAELLQDRDFQVRLATLLALADRPSATGVGQALVQLLNSPTTAADRWLPDAATAAAAQHAVSFFQAVAQDETEGISEPLLRSATIVAEHVARGDDDAAVEALLLALPNHPPAIAEAVVSGLAAGWPNDRSLKLQSATEERLIAAFDRFSLATRSQLIRLADVWGSDRFASFASEIVKSLLSAVTDEENSTEQRVVAAAQLVEFRRQDPESALKLIDQISPQTDPELAVGILGALRGSEAVELGSELIERMPEFTPAQRTATIAVLLRRPAWTAALVDGLEERIVQLSELSLEQQRNLSEHPDEQIASRAERLLMQGGSLPSPDRQEVIAAYMAATENQGDLQVGKQIFEKNCANCHVYGKLGKEIGPELTGMAVHPREELLVHILDPNASVEGNFRVYSVVTLDGLVLNGLLASESKTSVELFNSEGEKQIVLKEDIDQLVASPKSLMPEGFEKQISVAEMTSLLEFLTQRGKYVPLALSRVATTPSDRGMFIARGNELERLILPKWGVVPFRDIPFYVADPQNGSKPNVIQLYGRLGNVAREMPREVTVQCDTPAKAIHLLSGIGGWAYPYNDEKTVSMIVRLNFADGESRDYPLKNGVHFADYIRRIDVPGSEFAFQLRGQQLRYLKLEVKRDVPLKSIDFIKGEDNVSPVVMAVTVEGPESEAAE